MCALYLACCAMLIGGAVPAAGVERVWLESGVGNTDLPVRIAAAPIAMHDASESVSIKCVIDATRIFSGSTVSLRVRDAQGEVFAEHAIHMKLTSGENACTFKLDAAALPPGSYTAVFSVGYSGSARDAVYEARLLRISADHIKTSLARLDTELAALGGELDALKEAGTSSAYLDMRFRIATDFAGKALEDTAMNSWRAAFDKVSYLEDAAKGLRAGLAADALPPELMAAAARPDLSRLVVRGSGLYAEGRPVFLFGRTLARAPADEIARLSKYGLNFAALSFGPRHTQTGPERRTEAAALLDPVFAAAKQHNFSLTVALAPHDLPAWALQRWPDIKDKGFVDVANAGARQVLLEHIAAVAPYLAKQDRVNSVSLGNTPKFRFDGEAVRKGFVERVRALYPDRLKLNRDWRAKLADHDDISIWSADPLDWYQQRRTYQFDWQAYHRGLATAYFNSIREAVRKWAPSLPLQVNLSDTAFELGETRGGIDREAIAGLMEIQGCSSINGPESEFYALNYPHAAAFFTLLRSIAPDKPIFDLDSVISLDEKAAPAHIFRYVHSAVWDAVISGLSAAALASDSAIFARGEALEGFATASLDVNRLAPIVRAFQQAPADVAILFSDTSKVLGDGDPHLESALFAYEGSSFGGYNVRYITEAACAAGKLEGVRMLILPQTPAVSDETFDKIVSYVEAGNTIARVGTPIPYDERGDSRKDVIQHTGNTVLVRGMNLPTEYLHAMDAAAVKGALPGITRPVNRHGYPIEGVKTRTVAYKGTHYLYIVNLRKTPVTCLLAGQWQSGRDLIRGREVTFPRVLEPLEPMLIRLESVDMAAQKLAKQRKPGSLRRWFRKITE